MKHICLDCHTFFDVAQKKEVTDHTGFDGIYIDVCPQCMSNHIEPVAGKYLLVMDKIQYKHLTYADGYFRNQVKENLLYTNDPTIADHYRSLLIMSELIFKNIKKL
jgi:hypothetical protein